MEKKCKSFHLAGHRSSPQIESHENWAILGLLLFNLLFLVV